MNVSQPNRKRDGSVAYENDQSEKNRSGFDLSAQLRSAESQRLKHAGNAVTDMGSEQYHREDVRARNDRILKTEDHHRKNVVSTFGIGHRKMIRVGDSEREVKKVIDEKGKN